ncbi:GerMN domain-containing protein [Arthrobacter agilis]|uniref:GerMN domain-containing protein n=1 Tax=Arthrobacter agilis TaxID=37921 RepID=UPI00278033A2|nr:GerMN domain-containing protein [Arthrobacter agilis]MDQ0734930.1 hypothetical protein [Arthrobacter agilis]
MSEQDPLKRSRLGLPGILLVSGGVLVASSVFIVPNVGLFQGGGHTTAIAEPFATAAPEGSAPSDPSVQTQGAAAGPAEAQPLLPVYWLGDVEGSDRLFREFLPPPEGATGDPIADAVQLMTAGRPLDPDYRSPWQQASSVRSAISTKNVITLDMSSDAFSSRLDEDAARLALQQLVYTATAAASNAGLIPGGESSSVVVLVDGAADVRAFGAVDLVGEWTRDSAALGARLDHRPPAGRGSGHRRADHPRRRSLVGGIRRLAYRPRGGQLHPGPHGTVPRRLGGHRGRGLLLLRDAATGPVRGHRDRPRRRRRRRGTGFQERHRQVDGVGSGTPGAAGMTGVSATSGRAGG